jgi:hypothetical protein
MSIPDPLIRVSDPKLGIIYTMPTAPVTFSSSQGTTTLFAVNGSGLPDGVLLNPAIVKYQIQSYQLNNPLGENREYIEPFHLMEIYPEYSYDSSNWSSYDKWSVNPHDGMTGRMRSNIQIKPLPQYMRVTGRLYADLNGDTTATVQMGFENFLL